MSALWRVIALGLGVALAMGAAQAQTLLDTTLVLGKKPDAVILPFTAAAGNYRITVTDFGTPAGPVRLGRIDAGVMHGSALVTSVNLTNASSTAVSTKTFTATAGEHRLVLVGQPAAPARVGSVGVRIDDPVSGTVLLDTLQAFTVPSPPVTSPADFEHEFAVSTGSYTLETTDFALPQGLAVLHTTVIRKSTGSVMAFEAPATAPIALTVGTDDIFEVFIHAELGSSAVRGLIGVSLRDTATNTTQASATHELGEWPYRYAFDLPADTSVGVTLNDLGFPFALTGLAGEVVHDGRRAVPTLTAPAAVNAAAVAGSYTVYVNAAVPTAGPGSFGLRVTPAGAAPVVDTVQNVVAPAPASDVGTVDEGFDIATAGNYTLTFTDFGASGFFDAFTSVTLALTHDDSIVGTLDRAGSIAFAAVAGHYNIAVIADPAGSAGDGLLGIVVRGGPSDTVVFDRTEAIGTAFITSTVDVSTATNVNVTLTDLAFPALFGSIKVAVTRGATRAGEIIGAGTFSFAATPGRYVVNLLATPNSTVGYSTLGISASVASPAPVVTLSASAASVQVGSNVTLTWSVANATSCTASGSWSGAKATTGTESVGPLNANASYTLTCAGPGGSGVSSVSVSVTPEQRQGGGGAFDPWMLSLLVVVYGLRRRRFPV